MCLDNSQLTLHFCFAFLQLEMCYCMWHCCWNVSDKKATEIPSDLFSVSAESNVTVANLSRNCLTAVPAQSVFHCSLTTDNGNRHVVVLAVMIESEAPCNWSMTEERGDNFVFVCYKYYQNYSVYCYFFLYFDAVNSVKGIWTEESLCHLFPEVLLWTSGGGNWVTACLKKTGKCLGKILSGKTVCCEWTSCLGLHQLQATLCHLF